MRVRVRLFTILRELAGKGDIALEFNVEVVTVSDVLRELVRRFGRNFGDYLLNQRGKVQDHLQLLVNGRNIELMKGLDTHLEEGDIVAIVPPVGGG